MQYRTIRRTGDRVGVIGVGTASAGSLGAAEAERIAASAVEHGVNYFDMGAGDVVPFAAFGQVFQSCRKNVFLQMHFGADYTSGKYAWTTDLEQIKRSVDWQMRALRTDYIDYGFIHCVDEQEDLNRIRREGTIEYIQTLQAEGVVRHIGLSTHSPALANAILDLGVIDVMMFSINPSYDFLRGEYALGQVGERAALYARCARDGVGISVMKPFSSGQLLDAKTSPFGVALTEAQCLQYALDTPGVVTVVPGVRSCEDLTRVLAYFDASPAERELSVLKTLAPTDVSGRCVYCSHCQPCPAGLDIGLINKYYDLARAGDSLAAEHYRTLDLCADGCIGCGHCADRCPFGVDQPARMREIAAYFHR